MPDQQMRSGTPRYPVDRYLVESSNTIEMVNIMDDELWRSEPALRPEDELILRRLHDMLQTTADDLKLLSGELAKYHQPGVQIKTQPTPLDEEFNEKVHIEELVNAKFHGYKIVDNPTPITPTGPKVVASSKPNVNTGVQVDSTTTANKPVKRRNLEITRTRILEIDEKIDKDTKQKLNNGKVINNAAAVAYNEFTYQHVEPQVKTIKQNKLKVQDMPSINIRSELKEQKVLQLDIFPDSQEKTENTGNKNVAVIAFAHETSVQKQQDPQITLTNKGQTSSSHQVQVTRRSLSQTYIKKEPIRKVSKMSTCESSESTNNVSSDTRHNIKTQKQIKSVIRSSPNISARDRVKSKKTSVNNKESDKRTHFNLDDWKRKLSVVYGQPSSSKNSKSKQAKKSPKISNIPASSTCKPVRNQLNNGEYIPYSHLTLGGVRVSDVEKEIGDVANKNDIPLTPIIDKLLSSRENSFHKESPKKNKKDSRRIFTTSDENLLQEVIDIERAVSTTIEKNTKKKVDKKENKLQNVSSESKVEDNTDSYADDFEDENTENTETNAKKDNDNSSHSGSKQHRGNNTNSESGDDSDSDNGDNKPNRNKTQIHNRTYTKKSNLSIKNQVDVFEFVHSVDTQDSATQSNTTHKISLKETQTSPRNEKPKINPIHNDLWPADPKGEVEKMFKLEKDFIKKLILEEYGDFFEKNINKPSTSKDAAEGQHNNVTATQKITQTSPARAKSVMTSPTRTKTRTTSPFMSLTVDHQTSPMIVVTNEEHLTVEVNNEEDSISINLSSPRFSLRLPQTSREVLSNLEVSSLSPSKVEQKDKAVLAKAFRKSSISSSSSEVENSSEMSSLGEVRLKLKRRFKKRVKTISESSETSSTSKYSSDIPSGGIIPLRSEGEVSLGQRVRKVSNKTSKSEGETSLGRSK